jgi:gamma-glutamyltranspeptidase/glutathione hydrolase
VHLEIEASRLAQLDRREYVGDPDFHPVPVRGLLAGGYLDTRFGLFSPMRAIHPVIPGTPPGSASDGAADMTSHVSIVDRRGNAVSMTTTVNGAFGAHMEASGMILNNAQENFTRLDSISPGARVNAMAPDKRPRTAMGPAIAFGPRGRLRLVLGAAGGSAIPDYIAQTFLGITLDGMDPATAVAQGHWSGQEIASNCGGAVDAVSQLEAGTAAAALLDELRARSHPCPEVGELRSGLAAIAVGRVGLTGAADPRRDGAAVGF